MNWCPETVEMAVPPGWMNREEFAGGKWEWSKEISDCRLRIEES
jgi:hypothetical protein